MESTRSEGHTVISHSGRATRRHNYSDVNSRSHLRFRLWNS